MSTNIVLVLLLGLVGVFAVDDPWPRLAYRRPVGTKPSVTETLGSAGLGIYKGKATSIQKHPSLVVMTYYDSFMCAGNIIGDSWVLISGDCVSGIDPSQLKIIAGTQDGSGGKTYDVVASYVHPNYGSSSFDYDYALLKIKGKFKWSSKVKKIGLPKKQAKAGSTVTIAGWGSTAADAENAQLREGKMQVISQKACATAYDGFGLNFTPRMGCVYNKGKTTPCNDDWSDPITTSKEVLDYMFVAIATSGECTSSAYPAICASVYPAVSWIQDVTGEEY